MKALIIEDEILAAKHLLHVLGEVGGISVINVLESITETIEWFNSNAQPELVFMDIHLADGSAFEIFNHISISCPIIFTTAYDEYALKAFKVNSIDYLLKPVDVQSVKDALSKLKGLSASGRLQDDIRNLIISLNKPSAYKSHFLIPVKGDKLIPLMASEIAYVFIDAGLVKAITFDNCTHRFDCTLDELAGSLDPSDFFRANRQFIIARRAIKDIDIWFNSRLSVNLKVTLPEKILISKARIPEFRRWFGGET
jgi:two-component system LytT family response regulator